MPSETIRRATSSSWRVAASAAVIRWSRSVRVRADASAA